MKVSAQNLKKKAEFHKFLSAYIWLYMQQLSAAKRVSREIPKIDNDKTLLYS